MVAEAPTLTAPVREHAIECFGRNPVLVVLRPLPVLELVLELEIELHVSGARLWN